MIVIDTATAAWAAAALFTLLAIYGWISDRRQRSKPAGQVGVPSAAATPAADASARHSTAKEAERVRRLAARKVGQALFIWASPYLDFSCAVVNRGYSAEQGAINDIRAIYAVSKLGSIANVHLIRYDELASHFAGLAAEDLLFGDAGALPLTERIAVDRIKWFMVALLGENTPRARPQLPRWWKIPALEMRPSPLPREAFGKGNAGRHGPWVANCASLHARSVVMRYQSRIAGLVQHLLDTEMLENGDIESVCGNQSAAKTSPSAS